LIRIILAEARKTSKIGEVIPPALTSQLKSRKGKTTMNTKLDVVAVAAALSVLVTPVATSAQTLFNAPPEYRVDRQRQQPSLKPLPGVYGMVHRAAHRNVIRAEGGRTPAVVSPRGRVIGTDPSLAVRFELNRDSARGL
jgi:hypothetical protein